LAKEKNLIHIWNPALFTKQVSLDLKTSLFFLHQEPGRETKLHFHSSQCCSRCRGLYRCRRGSRRPALHCTAHTGTYCSLPQREQHCSLPQPGTRSHADGLNHRARTATGPSMVSGKEKDADAPRMSARIYARSRLVFGNLPKDAKSNAQLLEASFLHFCKKLKMPN